MCGIVAVLDRSRSVVSRDLLLRMVGRLRRRGPDAQVAVHEGPIGLAHARLSIIDLAGGGQPIYSAARDLACILNGEIYNYRELRKELERAGRVFVSHSDTEVLLHLFAEFGPRAFDRLDGMFAAVIADFSNERLVVVRDRMGEKPLYQVDGPGFYACASELKALLEIPGLDADVDSLALADYLRFGYVTGDRSIAVGVTKLLPGQYAVVTRDRTVVQSYWAPPTHVERGVSRAEWIERTRVALRGAIRNKLVADVPVGVFLSGGLDSSTVVALAAGESSAPLRTFSARFGNSINELPLARRVAEKYGTIHTELDVDGDIASATAAVMDYFDEPFADSSAVPTYLISRAAREHVTVVLTGDGGDELFGGYDAYISQRRWTPNPAFRKVVHAIDRIPAFGHAIADAISQRQHAAGAIAAWQQVRSTFLAGDLAELLPDHDAAAHDGIRRSESHDALAAAMRWDIGTYLPDDLLCKVDRASMACSLETRAPLLDHQLVEFALTVPAIEKVRGGTTKSLFRDAVEPWLPREIVRARKQGFGAPLVHWLSGPLRDAVADVRNGARLGSVLDLAGVRRIASRAEAALASDWRAPLQLWTLIALDRWLARRSAVAAAGPART